MDVAGRTVVVVEDEPLIRDCEELMFGELGLAVAPFETADEALSYIEANEKDIAILVTDIRVPGSMSGLDLAHQVFRRWPGIRVVLTSGRTFVESSTLPPSARFLAKPWSPLDMLRVATE